MTLLLASLAWAIGCFVGWILRGAVERARREDEETCLIEAFAEEEERRAGRPC